MGKELEKRDVTWDELSANNHPRLYAFYKNGLEARQRRVQESFLSGEMPAIFGVVAACFTPFKRYVSTIP